VLDSSSCCPQGNSEDFNGTVKTSVSPVLRWVSTGVAAGPGEKVARATRERQKFPLRERQATEEKVYNPEDGSRPGTWLVEEGEQGKWEGLSILRRRGLCCHQLLGHTELDSGSISCPLTNVPIGP
jgi:hypothetical protein